MPLVRTTMAYRVFIAPVLGLVLATGPALAQGYADSWHCKANGNIPIGTLTIDAAGNYEMIVAANAAWDPKPNDAGNGVGQLAVAGDTLTPISGPLADVYEVVGGYSEENQRFLGWANGQGGLALFACWPASEGN